MIRASTPVTVLAATTLALGVLLAVGCGQNAADKAGGSGSPVTLSIGTDDTPGRPASDAIEYFADQVQELSDDTIRIEPEWQAAGPNIRAWDQRVARMVVDGELEMGMIPARAWDTEGVTSLRALQAPFLVTDDALLDEVVAGDLADEMLAGLEEAGVVGLALVPEGLRHPAGLGTPLLSADDYEGATIRAPLSNTSYNLLRALGAKPVDLGGQAFMRAAAKGVVDGVESSFQFATTLPEGVQITGNVVLFPKANALVVNAEDFEGLTDEQRATLQEAADLTREHAIETRATDADAAAEACKAGSVVVSASAADLDGLVEAAQPVYAQLERDQQTRSLIERIRTLKRRTSASAPAPTCAPAEITGG